jgi:hypothetical protein
MLVQLVLVVIFIVFEEIIWEGFAKPIYIFIHELRLLQKLQEKLQSVNRYVILILFMLLLIGVEAAGVTAGIMAVKGMVLSAVLLYALKIPIAAFTFWLFRATEEKLLSFGWFKYLYEKIVAFFAWIKSRKIYQSTISMSRELKGKTKLFIKQFKQNYLSGENTISKRFKRLYRFVKRVVRREDKASS